MAAKQDHEVKVYVQREEVDQTRYRVHERADPTAPTRTRVLDRFEQFAGRPVEEGIVLDEREERTVYHRERRPSRSRSPRGPAIEVPE